MSKSKARTPSEHPNPTTKIGSKMGGEFTYPKWDPIGFDPQPDRLPQANDPGEKVIYGQYQRESNIFHPADARDVARKM